MRVAVMGSGGLGSLLGALLARGGQEVAFIARGENLAALRARPLQVLSAQIGDFTVHVRATEDPSEIGPVDLVLFTVKAFDLDLAAEQMRPLVGPRTMVLPLLNGVDTAVRLGRFVPPQQILGGVAHVSARRSAPGVVEHARGLRLIIGELAGGTSARTGRLHALLQQAGLAAEGWPNVRVALWEKFLFECAFAGVAALARLPFGAILACSETHALCRTVMEEVARLAAARVASLPPDVIERAFREAAALDPTTRGFMAADLEAGRPLELEALNGTVVRLGQEHQLPTPANFAVYAALKPYSQGRPYAEAC